MKTMNAVQCTKFLSLIPLHYYINCMVGAIVNTTNIDSLLLKQLSRMRDAGLSINDISQQLDIDANTVKTLLGLLGYAVTY